MDLYCFGVVTVEEYNVGVLRFKCIFQEFMYVCVICSYPKKKKKRKKKCVICYMLWVAQVFVSIVPLKWVRV